jgi:hypothetical protein
VSSEIHIGSNEGTLMMPFNYSVPIHAVGYTKSHEPSPLWLLSNATHGTYVSLTNDWNQLRGGYPCACDSPELPD